MAFRGKVALITGGGSGMGQLAAQRLADAGAKVAILDVNEQGMAQTAEGRPGIKPYKVDISDVDAVKAVVQAAEAELGPIDRVANAAAIMPFGLLLEQDPKTQLKQMTINYGGLVSVATAALPGMVQRGSGDFISFASMAGIVPGIYMGGYNASKAAVAMYTEVLWHENLNSGVRFCCVCPPPVATPLLQQGYATIMPKIVSDAGTLQPGDVLDDIEACLEGGKFWSFPGKGTRVGYFMRRFAPNLVWKTVHKTEGR